MHMDEPYVRCVYTMDESFLVRMCNKGAAAIARGAGRHCELSEALNKALKRWAIRTAESCTTQYSTSAVLQPSHVHVDELMAGSCTTL
jgi:hypothetical protein